MSRNSDTGAASPPPAVPFAIGGEEVAPGSRSQIEIRVARLPTGAWLSLPLEVVHGGRPGPALWLGGAIHGDELDGVEIIRRVLDDLRPDRLRGTVVGVPVVNLFGVVNESRYLPDRRDLNRSFPGSAKGSLAARVAHLFMTEVVARCDVGIDFHCGSDGRDNLPQVRANLDDPDTRALALAFAAPVTIHGKAPDGSLRKAVVQQGGRVLLYEGGEARRFTPEAIEEGVAGVHRVLRFLRMLGSREEDPGRETVEVRSTRWVRAGRSGICRMEVEPGDRVETGGRIGLIRDVHGGKGYVVRSRARGIVLGRRINPLVYQGEALAHIAEVDGAE